MSWVLKLIAFYRNKNNLDSMYDFIHICSFIWCLFIAAKIARFSFENVCEYVVFSRRFVKLTIFTK